MDDTTATLSQDPALTRRLERLGLTGQDSGDWTDRYLLSDHVVDPPLARPRQRFEATAKLIRDLLAHRWVKTRQTRERANPKRTYVTSCQGPVPSIDAPSAGLILGGFRPRIARFRFTQHPEA
jgi:hypothetical protein